MNINTVKQLLKKNIVVDAISRIICSPIFLCERRQYESEAELRNRGKEDKKLLWIRNLKDSHKGERCFIVATGPSLTIDDLELIKNEYSFSMNSVVKVLKETTWRPSFYAIQDIYVYEKLEKEILECSNNYDFPIAVEKDIYTKYTSAQKFNMFQTNRLDHKMFHKTGFGTFRFSDDCYKEICDGYTITFSVMQLACYMGFKKIYLLGCDCNYKLPKTHFVEYGHKDPKAAIMGNKMIAGHQYFRKFAEEHGVKVVNCTRGGMLEVYPRKLLEDVLG